MHLKFEFCLINQELVVNQTVTAQKTSKNILETRGFDLNHVYFVHKDFLIQKNRLKILINPMSKTH